jgi:hypothetical protein
VRKSAHTLLRNDGFCKEHPAFSTAIEEMKFAREAPHVAEWTAARPIIEDGMTSILRDDAPVLETLESAERSVGNLLQSKSDQ